jgi:hypothetical protein
VLTIQTLTTLANIDTSPVVSLFLPTAPSTSKTLESPTHLNNLLRDARAELAKRGMSSGDIDELLSPVIDHTNRPDYWQHQDHGLALFVSRAGVFEVKVSGTVGPGVFVGDYAEVTPLLPHLNNLTRYALLCASEGEVSAYIGDAAGLTPHQVPYLPNSLDDIASDDNYENPVSASPPARPNTGSHNMSNAQVFGDAPPEWREKVRNTFAADIASAISRDSELSGLPLVVIADEKLAGLLGKWLTVEAVDTSHPTSMSTQQRHERSLALLPSTPDNSAVDAIDEAARRLNTGEAVASDSAEIAVLAGQGRVETLVVTAEESNSTISESVLATLRHGGDLVWAGGSDRLSGHHTVALLRY